MRFTGQVAFITGAATGFGYRFAEALAAEGAAIAVVDIDGERAGQAAEQLRAQGHQALPLACDVADRAQMEQAVASTREALGGIDILINNAGLHLTRYNRPFSQMPVDDLQALMNVNVIGVANGCVACRDALRERKGVIINIASMAAHLSVNPYAVSKLAVRGMTVAFAHEFAEDGIRVNAISPGLMLTESAEQDLPQAMKDHVINRMQLIHRAGVPADIVSAMLFLCSKDASFITGETLKVTGGHPLYI